jgi:hypothetical protein
MENDLNFLPFLYQGDMLFFQRTPQVHAPLPASQTEEQRIEQEIEPNPAASLEEKPQPTPQHEPQEQPKEFRFIGKNQKQILIILEDENAAQMLLAPADQALLENVLGAGKVMLSDVAILNLKAQPLLEPRLFWATVRRQFAPRYIWVVGDLMSNLGLPAAKSYLPTEYKDLVFLVSDTLETLAQDRQKKFALWQALKTLPFYQG